MSVPPPPFALLFGPQTWQTFRDDQEAEDIYPLILHGTWSERYEELRELNAAGAGIYYCVNETDGNGRRAENITEVRAWYTDIDGIADPKAKRRVMRQLMEHPTPPSCVIETRNGLHALWYALPGTEPDKEAYEEVERGLIGYWGGDPSAKDLSRVLRAPLFQHAKRKPGQPKPDPFEIRVLFEEDRAYYSESEMRAAFPPKARDPKRVTRGAFLEYSEDDWGKVASALAAWRPVEQARHRVMTLACGVAYKFRVPEAQCVADLMPIVTGWDTGRDMGAELKRTARWAYQQSDPATVTALRREGVDVPRLSAPKD